MVLHLYNLWILDDTCSRYHSLLDVLINAFWMKIDLDRWWWTTNSCPIGAIRIGFAKDYHEVLQRISCSADKRTGTKYHVFLFVVLWPNGVNSWSLIIQVISNHILGWNKINLLSSNTKTVPVVPMWSYFTTDENEIRYHWRLIDGTWNASYEWGQSTG